MTEFTYANGQSIAVARKWLKFYFGDFLQGCKKNDAYRRFDIYVFREILTKEGIIKLEDYVDMEYFNSYWDVRQFKVILIKEEN